MYASAVDQDRETPEPRSFFATAVRLQSGLLSQSLQRSRSFRLRRLRGKRRIKCRVVAVLRIRLVQSFSISFHPSVRSKFSIFFSNSDAELRRDSLAAQQIPEHK